MPTHRPRLELAATARLNYAAFLHTSNVPGAASMEINALQNQLKDLGARALSLRRYL
jgi:hypothetical protein